MTDFLESEARKLDPSCASVFVWPITEAPQEYVDRANQPSVFWESVDENPDGWFLVIDIMTRRQEIVCNEDYRPFVRSHVTATTLQ